ncbi:anaphase-promoting complex subunit cdc27 [Entophlyctis sp. JEL0112]|nr:anaphase-promoting complex subunit cdc27 [Entophlyctis sp. JEL0112]
MARFLLARACIDLGKFNEAEDSLSKLFSMAHNTAPSGTNSVSGDSDTCSCSGQETEILNRALEKYHPDDSSVNYLMGIIYRKTSTTALAQSFLEAALSINPFLWIACEALCDMGVKIVPGQFFTDSSVTLYLTDIATTSNHREGKPYDGETSNLKEVESITVATTKRSRQPQSALIRQPVKRESKRTKLSLGLSQQVSEFGNELVPVPNQKDSVVQIDIIKTISIMARAHSSFKSFNCSETIEILNLLDLSEQETGWTAILIAQSYFEMAEYEKAEEWFLKARTLEPHCVLGMDLFSSTLWHLRKEYTLSHLAHELVEFHRMTPQAWCAIGNCFSLKKEHDVALKCFTRAVQIDGDCSYAYTLCGHECISMEDNEKALQYFRMALRCNKRHYNAWFGMGYVYLSQEKYDLAEFHFKRALEINNSNPVLILYMGVTYEKKNEHSKALSLYRRAIHIRPDIPLYPFRLASLLQAQTDYQSALTVLQPLVSDRGAFGAGGTESSVHFLMGKCLNGIGDTHGAIRAFTSAQDYATGRVASAIKEEIEKMVSEEDEEVRF